jgi:dynactin complex subunit
MATPEILIGTKVEVASGTGVVKWTGANPKFATGNWVGVEL